MPWSQKGSTAFAVSMGWLYGEGEGEALEVA